MVLLARFETEAEKKKRLKEQALAKEMANVAIAFKLSEPSPMYETVIPPPNDDVDSKKIIVPKVSYADKEEKGIDIKPSPELLTFSKPSTSTRLTRRPKTTARQIKKTIEIVHARPTTSPAKRPEKLPRPPVALSSVKQDTSPSQLPGIAQTSMKSTTSGWQVTGNKINFETHIEETEAEKLAKPKSKRLVKMQLSSGSSNYRYADGLDRSPDIKVISPMNT